MKVFDYESRARLQRMRNHMAMDKLAKIERGRYGWTHYSKGSKADDGTREKGMPDVQPHVLET